MRPGDVLVLPGGWIGAKAGHAIMHILLCFPAAAAGSDSGDRNSKVFSFVTCNTGGGLGFHPSSVSDDGGKMLFRTSIRIDGVSQASVEDDAFWLLFWRLQSVQSDDHDHHALYEILLPTLAGRPLAEAISEQDPCAAWRTPQRAGTCFLKCVLECIRYLCALYGMTPPQCKQSSFAVRRLWLSLCAIDLDVAATSLDNHAYHGDDKAREKRRAKALQREMRREGVPMPLEKAPTVPGARPSQDLMVGAEEQKSDPSSRGGNALTQADEAESEVDEPAPEIVSVPAEPVSAETTPLHDASDLSMIRLATKQTAHAALKEAKAGRLDATEMAHLWAEIERVETRMAALPLHVHTSSHVQPRLDMEQLE